MFPESLQKIRPTYGNTVETRYILVIWSISSFKSECYARAFLFFYVSMVTYSQSLNLTKASFSHPPQQTFTRNYHFYFIKVNTYGAWHFLKRGLKIIIMCLYLLFLTTSPPKNHSVQTTARPTPSGKSRFRKKGDIIDSTTYEKENTTSQPDTLWDAAGC